MVSRTSVQKQAINISICSVLRITPWHWVLMKYKASNSGRPVKGKARCCTERRGACLFVIDVCVCVFIHLEARGFGPYHISWDRFSWGLGVTSLARWAASHFKGCFKFCLPRYGIRSTAFWTLLAFLYLFLMNWWTNLFN